MGMALTSCTVPAAGKPNFELGEGEIEMGIGIHGEPGRERMPLRPATEMAAHMTEAILADLPFRGGDRVIAMVSGMGGTPLLELYLVYRELEQILRARQITVRAAWSATTSPASTWPAARSRCGPTTSCCPCGTTRC